jgi:hypothetical protein
MTLQGYLVSAPIQLQQYSNIVSNVTYASDHDCAARIKYLSKSDWGVPRVSFVASPAFACMTQDVARL